MHSVAKAVWYRIVRDAEAAWDDPDSDCITWGYSSPLEMAAKFLLDQPYVVYGGRAVRTLRTTVTNHRNEQTRTVCQSVKAGEPTYDVLMFGLPDCRVIIGPNGATIIKSDASKPNLSQLKDDVKKGWRYNSKTGKRQPAAVIDRTLGSIPEEDVSQAVVHPPFDPRGTQRDVVTGPTDGVPSLVDDVLVVNPGGHDDRLRAADGACMTVPFENWTSSPVWTRQDMAARRRSSKQWYKDRAPSRQVRHLGQIWAGQGDEAQRDLIAALRSGLNSAETRFETDALIM